MFSSASNPTARAANARAAFWIDEAAALGAVDRRGLASLEPRVASLAGATAFVAPAR